MATEKDNVSAPDPNARILIPEDKKKAAAKWFEQAAKLVSQRNYDYAVKSFVEGLSLNPEAVEQGWVPLRGCAVARKHSGGKKPGMMDSVKFSMTTKDPLKGLSNAAWLYAHDPDKSTYCEGIVRNANKARCDSALFWVIPIYLEALNGEKKPEPKKFSALKDICEELGDRCQERGELADGIVAYEAGVEALVGQRNVEPNNRELANIIRDLSTKLTILKGNYQTADSFKDSIRDTGEQARLHDEDRMVQTEERLAELIASARKEMEANPTVDAKAFTVAELLCRVESDANEKAAIELLLSKHKEGGNYRFKLRADDIAARQLGRHAREAKKAGDIAKAKELMKRRLLFEEKMFAERVSQYPTDLRIKHEFGRRLFLVRKFDEAIPMLQQARSDPKVRDSCELHLGRAFFEKGLYSQASDTLQAAVDRREMTEDDTAKELNYWLARSQQEGGKPEEAKQTYGKLLQIDYNYRDVRKRLEELK